MHKPLQMRVFKITHTNTQYMCGLCILRRESADGYLRSNEINNCSSSVHLIIIVRASSSSDHIAKRHRPQSTIRVHGGTTKRYTHLTKKQFTMRIANIIQVLAVIIGLSTVLAFRNPYPRYKAFHDGGDPGEPLFLTDLIKAGDLEKAREDAKVQHEDMTAVASYSGYFTVDKKLGANTFFWYFPAEVAPANASVLVWLQGGPGASSLFGLFSENGPYSIASTGALKRRKYSWHLQHHIIYIDNPVGTGFSFVTDERGYAKTESDVGNNLYEAVSQFFQLFPDLRSHPFYITGESYAGKYVPALGHTIHERNRHSKPEEQINLAGLAIGNGLSDPQHQMNYGDYLYQLGLIDANGQQKFTELEKKGIDLINKHDYTGAFDIFDELINMDENPNGSLFKNLTGFPSYFNYINPSGDSTADQAMGKFLQSSVTRRAIHVGNQTFHDLEGENKVEEHLKADVMQSVAQWVSELLSFYRVLIYNGQLDVIVAYPLTENYLRHLKFNGDAQYKTAERIVWHVDGQVAGYVKHAGNLTEVLVRNAGHMVPGDQPKWALDMILRMTSGKGFVNPIGGV